VKTGVDVSTTHNIGKLFILLLVRMTDVFLQHKCGTLFFLQTVNLRNDYMVTEKHPITLS